jgi:hypothetical protein
VLLTQLLSALAVPEVFLEQLQQVLILRLIQLFRVAVALAETDN